MTKPRFLNRWCEADTGEPQTKPFQTKGLAFGHARRMARETQGPATVDHEHPVSDASPNWAVVERWEFTPDGRVRRVIKPETV
uniref:Uncharacterized protein n=1 Tax=Caulobacter phage BL57 TaxID=3348355 RepID=A0AB74UN08_9VIRU